MNFVDIGPESAGLLAPHDLIFVKGWSRSLGALTIALCAFDSPVFLQDRSGVCNVCG